jgi:hypothetical protein
LQTITQRYRTCSTYLESAKVIVDQLAAAGKSIHDQDLISCFHGGMIRSLILLLNFIILLQEIKTLLLNILMLSY